MPYLVKDTAPSASGKTTAITLDAEHPEGTYPTWRVSFDHRKGQPAPTTGMTIQCTPVANDQGYYWIKTWHPVEANAGPQQVGAAVQPTVNGIARPNGVARPAASNKLDVLLAPDKIAMAVMGIIGRHVANMKDFPAEGELTGMVKNAACSYINGLTQAMNPEVAPPPVNEEPDWPNP
mgnify:CR=1 FL=1|tara:strand:+ start:568 stop:1101 length:534 start_codon:yes stop_codon:yes gene_type:complete